MARPQKMNENDLKTLLRELSKPKGKRMSQTKLAQELGVNQSTISRWLVDVQRVIRNTTDAQRALKKTETQKSVPIQVRQVVPLDIDKFVSDEEERAAGGVKSYAVNPSNIRGLRTGPQGQLVVPSEFSKMVNTTCPLCGVKENSYKNLLSHTRNEHPETYASYMGEPLSTASDEGGKTTPLYTPTTRHFPSPVAHVIHENIKTNLTREAQEQEAFLQARMKKLGLSREEVLQRSRQHPKTTLTFDEQKQLKAHQDEERRVKELVKRYHDTLAEDMKTFNEQEKKAIEDAVRAHDKWLLKVKLQGGVPTSQELNKDNRTLAKITALIRPKMIGQENKTGFFK